MVLVLRHSIGKGSERDLSFIEPSPVSVRRRVVNLFYCFFAAERKVIKINKNLVEKKRGECADFRAEHYFPLKDTSRFVWKKRHTTTISENDRISISSDRRNLVIRRLTIADTALYSSEVETTGGLEVTQYWLVVRGE